MKTRHILRSGARLILAFLICAGGSAASKVPAKAGDGPAEIGEITGIIQDLQTSVPLTGVNVVVEGEYLGTTTGHTGEFRLSLMKPGEYLLLITHLGYAQQRLPVRVLSGVPVDLGVIELAEESIPLREIVVTPGSYAIMGAEASPRQTLSTEDVETMGWAEDVTRAVQRIPGISGNDFQAKFNIRGGETDEVLVLLDGMQLHEPFHQRDFWGGLFSTVDIETVEGVDLLTGGFTAEHGGRMSGVLKMRTKTPTEDRPTTSLGLSLMNARLFSMGRFGQARGSWLFSYRRGYLDVLNALMGDSFKLGPKYYDALGKVEYALSDRHFLSMSLFSADDRYLLDEKVVESGNTIPNVDYSNTHYVNNYGWLSLRSFFSDELRANTMLYLGQVDQRRDWQIFDDDPNAHFLSGSVDDDRDFRFSGLKQDWELEAADRLVLKAGYEYRSSRTKLYYAREINNEFIAANDSLVAQVDSHFADRRVNSRKLGAYFSARLMLLDPLTLEAGLRHDRISHSGDRLWSPRLNLVYALSPASRLRAGWGHYY